MEFYNSNILMDKLHIQKVIDIINLKNNHCNILVFGLGNDSNIWHHSNKHGYTLFVEDDIEWIENIKKSNEYLSILEYKYKTTVEESIKKINDSTYLNKFKIPNEIKMVEWDIIIIDGPAGYTKEQPGRAIPIYWASQISTNNTFIFIDDSKRNLESKLITKYIGRTSNTIELEGRGRFFIKNGLI